MRSTRFEYHSYTFGTMKFVRHPYLRDESLTVQLMCEIHRRISLVRKGFPSRTSDLENTSLNVRAQTRNNNNPKSPQVLARTP